MLNKLFSCLLLSQRRMNRRITFFQLLTTLATVNNRAFLTTTTAYLPSSPNNKNIALGIFQVHCQQSSKPPKRFLSTTTINAGSTKTKTTTIMPLTMTSSSNEEKESSSAAARDMDDDAMEDDDPKSQQPKQQPRRSPRKRKTRGETTTTTTTTGTPDTATLSSEDEKESSTPKKVKSKVPTKRKKAKSAAKKESIDEDDDGDSSIASSSSSSSSTGKVKKKKKKIPATKKKSKSAAKKKESIEDDESSVASSSSTAKKKKKSPATKKKKAADHQRITERDEIPKLWNEDKAAANGSYTFKIASWNVAGIRALIRKDPDALSNLCKNHDLDMLCLQETKLQESHLDDPKLKFRGCLKDDGYDDYWSCSTAKKGYSGTAVFIRQRGTDGGKKKAKQKSIKGFFGPKGGDGTSTTGSKKPAAEPKELPISSEIVSPTEVSYNIGKEIDNEGRTIIVDFPFATISNVYVPNSGQNLQRLDYRTKEWDNVFLGFMQQKQKDRNLPVIWLGDLNIAHKSNDVWNDGAKHLAKQAGVTPQERESFQSQLDSGFVDAFRKLHPDAKGHYSYWSQRAGNREPNKGLRLDYFVCSPDLFLDEENNNEKEDDTSNNVAAVVRDSYFITDQFGSDHCPAVLELEIKGEKK